MATKPTPFHTRRALLAGTFGGIAALAVRALGTPLPAAADGENVKVGGNHDTAQTATRLTNRVNDSHVFQAESEGDGTALRGLSRSSIAVYGSMQSMPENIYSSAAVKGVVGGTGKPARPDNAAVLGTWTDGPGVLGNSVHGPGVRGTSDENVGVRGVGPTGVLGTSSAGVGTRGSSSSGVGVAGISGSGFGVRAESSNGVALQVIGRARFDKASGLATIPAGEASVTVYPGFSVAGARILATLMGDAGGAFVERVFVGRLTGRFTIHLTAPTASDVPVAWLVISSG
jgi:hypothetical protein